MAQKQTGNAMKKMSQRALWRGDRNQSQMIESHGVLGMRSNLLRDTPTYKKDAIGLNGNIKNLSTSAKKLVEKNIPTGKTKTSGTKASIGNSILNSLKF